MTDRGLCVANFIRTIVVQLGAQPPRTGQAAAQSRSGFHASTTVTCSSGRNNLPTEGASRTTTSWECCERHCAELKHQQLRRQHFLALQRSLH